MTTTHAGRCDTDALNAVLRGEISAVETYDQAVSKFAGKTEAADLGVIREDHQRSVTSLREQIRTFGGEPSDGSGPWGAFATAVTGAAKLVGPETVLSALKQGEEHGVNDYQQLLENKDVADECKFKVRSELLPRCHQHIATIERLMAAK